MDDVPWPLVVMIFIGFLGWLRNRIREAAEIRRERAAQRRRENPTTSRPASVQQRQQQAPNRQSEPEPGHEVPGSLQDLIAQMQAHEEEQQKAPPPIQREIPKQAEPAALAPKPASAPPPLPDRTAKIPLADVDASERVGRVGKSELGKLSKVAGIAVPDKAPANVAADSYHSSRKRRSAAVRRVTKSFRDRRSLQSAIILKEILDTPKGLE